MHSQFYLPENPDYSLLDCVRNSVRFAHYCLTAEDCGRWRSRGSLVDSGGIPIFAKPLGQMEGPGWVGNSLGGAILLYRWGCFDHCFVLKHVALGLIDHVLDSGFITDEGAIRCYRTILDRRFALNGVGNSDWFCPGEVARVAGQMLDVVEMLPPSDIRVERLRDRAQQCAKWLLTCVPLVDNWSPVRCAIDGSPLHDLSFPAADGLYLAWLFMHMTALGMTEYDAPAYAMLRRFINDGGFYSGLHPDGDLDDMAGGRAVAYRLFRRAGEIYKDESFTAFARDNALAGLDALQVTSDEEGSACKGLVRTSPQSKSACISGCAQSSRAYYEAWEADGKEADLCCSITLLRAIARQQQSSTGFLPACVRWDSTPSCSFTSPLQHNLVHLDPAMKYLEKNG